MLFLSKNFTNRVDFIDQKAKDLFESLACGTFEEKELYTLINHALDNIKESPFIWIKIQKDRWPKEYILKYNIDNLWKYNLPKGWRLIYTIHKEKVEIISIILEWFSHKEYERKFGY